MFEKRLHFNEWQMNVCVCAFMWSSSYTKVWAKWLIASHFLSYCFALNCAPPPHTHTHLIHILHDDGTEKMATHRWVPYSLPEYLYINIQSISEVYASYSISFSILFDHHYGCWSRIWRRQCGLSKEYRVEKSSVYLV